RDALPFGRADQGAETLAFRPPVRVPAGLTAPVIAVAMTARISRPLRPRIIIRRSAKPGSRLQHIDPAGDEAYSGGPSCDTESIALNVSPRKKQARKDLFGFTVSVP